MKTRKTFQITNEISADVEVETQQQEAWSGDKMFAWVRISLPANGSGHLIEELRFGSRMSLCGEYLEKHWGTLGGGGLVREARWEGPPRENAVMAATAALEWCTTELGRLRVALAGRAEAAEESYVVQVTVDSTTQWCGRLHKDCLPTVLELIMQLKRRGEPDPWR